MIGIVAGLLGAGLALLLQSVAIAIAGFLGGGYVAIELLNMLGVGSQGFSWIPFIIGGVLGLILVSILFDWALIVLSSLVGAFMITQAVDPTLDSSSFIFFILLILGIIDPGSGSAQGAQIELTTPLALDHVVLVVSELPTAIRQFNQMGFTVTPGGVHAGGLTHNALVSFADGVYLELLATTNRLSQRLLVLLRRVGLLSLYTARDNAFSRRFKASIAAGYGLSDYCLRAA